MSRPKIAQRKDGNGALDDIVVEPVEMFRAERMDKHTWWLCCYLPGGERIAWWLTKGTLTVTEDPAGHYDDWDAKL